MVAKQGKIKKYWLEFPLQMKHKTASAKSTNEIVPY
jgi:hypothetical protein